MQSIGIVSDSESASRNHELRECEWMNREFPIQHFVDECALMNLMFLLFIVKVLLLRTPNCSGDHWLQEDHEFTLYP